MRVVIVIAAIARGGMERQVIDLAGGLQHRGHEVLLAVEKRVSDYADEIGAAGLTVRELRRDSGVDPRVVRDLARLLREFRADVVLCENFNATLWGRLAAAVVGVPSVTAEHSTDRGEPAKIRIANRILGRGTAAIVGCAEAQRSSLVREGNPADRIRVIANGVDVERFKPDREAGLALRAQLGIPVDAPVVGIVAAHRVEKRHDRFFDLVGDLREAGVPAWGLAVGGGPLLETNRALAARSRHAEHIVVPGPSAEMSAAYSALDVSVIVSDSDTFPLAVLESQACATPVVAVDVGGLRETVKDGEGGIIVPAGDAARLASAVTGLLTDTALRARMGDRARSWVTENLSTARMVHRYEQLLLEVLKGRR